MVPVLMVYAKLLVTLTLCPVFLRHQQEDLVKQMK